MNRLMLNAENYKRGFLVDEELMAGITEDPSQPGLFMAYVLRHTTGEYLGYRSFEKLDQALQALNAIPREWAFEKTSGCGGCKKGPNGEGSCDGSTCGKKTACVSC